MFMAFLIIKVTVHKVVDMCTIKCRNGHINSNIKCKEVAKIAVLRQGVSFNRTTVEVTF